MKALAGIPFVGDIFTTPAKCELKALVAQTQAYGNAPSASGQVSNLPWPVRKVLNEARDRLAEEDRSICSVRMPGGLDPDISSMRSLSPVYKSLKQRARNSEINDLFTASQKVLNW